MTICNHRNDTDWTKETRERRLTIIRKQNGYLLYERMIIVNTDDRELSIWMSKGCIQKTKSRKLQDSERRKLKTDRAMNSTTIREQPAEIRDRACALYYNFDKWQDRTGKLRKKRSNRRAAPHHAFAAQKLAYRRRRCVLVIAFSSILRSTERIDEHEWGGGGKRGSDFFHFTNVWTSSGVAVGINDRRRRKCNIRAIDEMLKFVGLWPSAIFIFFYNRK